MDESPSISVVIPSHNAAAFLPEAIESLLIQNYPKMEIILVDDNSFDNTPALAAAWNPAVRYVFSECGSPAAARNTGLRLSQADYIGFLDADDLWMPGRLPAQLAFHVAHPELDFSQGYTRKVFLASSLGSRTHIPRDYAAHLNPNPGSMLFRREAILRLGGFDESMRFGEDIDLWLRSRTSGLNGAVFEQVVLLYRMHAKNMTNFQNNEQRDLLAVLHKSILRQDKHPQITPANARLPHFSDRNRHFPLVSVVIIAPAPALHLKETLDSIILQSYPNLELVLVIDQPPDAIKHSDLLAAELPQNSILVYSEGSGFAHALNPGWRATRGEYLACAQAGDIWSEDRLRQQVGILLYNKQASMVLGDSRMVIDPALQNPAGASRLAIPPGGSLGAALIRRQALELVGELDPAFEEGAALEWLSRFTSGLAYHQFPIIVRLPRVVHYQRVEGPGHFNVRAWSPKKLPHILYRAIQHRREQEP